MGIGGDLLDLARFNPTAALLASVSISEVCIGRGVSRRICLALIVYSFVSTPADAQQAPDEAARLLEEAIATVRDRNGDHERALPIVELAANDGNSKAQSTLCIAYRLGRGVPEDKAAAFGWCLKAGEQGDSEAQYSMGRICAAAGRFGGNAIASLWFRKAAEQGHIDAQFALGEMYASPRPVTAGEDGNALENAIDWYRKAAGQGHAQAQFRLGVVFERGPIRPAAEEGDAIKWICMASEQGLAEAQVRLGDKFAEGDGVSQDYEEAFKWYLKALDSGQEDDTRGTRGPTWGGYDGLGRLAGLGFAPAAERIRVAAQQGTPQAQRSLAQMYAKGRGADQDFAMAFLWYGRLAEQSLAPAIVGFRELAERGHAPALEWIRDLAEQGNARAQLELGNMYASGQGLARDESEAADWFFLAAEQRNVAALLRLTDIAKEGNSVARSRLGLLAQRGSSRAQMSISLAAMSENPDVAYAWMRRAAEQNHSWAQAGLGVAYHSGMGGMKEDKEAAVAWTRKAAEQGVAMSQFLLGFMHYTGDGVPRDLVQAYAWLRAASEHSQQGGISALARLMDLDMRNGGAMIEDFNDRAARILGSERFSEAKQLAREYRERYVYPYQCGLLTDADEDAPEMIFTFNPDRR